MRAASALARGAVIVLMIASGASLSAQDKLPGTPARKMLPAVWDSVAAVPVEVAESVFNRPLSLVFLGENAVVVDFGDKALRAFDQRGRIAWSYTKRGKGPSEIDAPGAMTVGADGLGWLSDRGNARAYGFTPNGALVQTIQLDRMPERTVPLSATELFVVASLDSAPIVFDRRSGQAVRMVAFGEVASKAPRSSRIDVRAVGLPGDRVALAFSYASVIAIAQGNKVVKEIVGPVGEPFPPIKTRKLGTNIRQVLPDAKQGPVAQDISYSNDRLYVQSIVTNAAKNKNQRVSHIDIYDLKSMSYVGTIETPMRVEQVAVRGDIFAFLTTEPEPTLSFWRLRQGK